MKLTPWNLHDHLQTQEDIVGYINACLAEGDIDLIVHALYALTKHKGIDTAANAAALVPEDPVHALCRHEARDLAWFLRGLRSLGLELHVFIAPPREI